MIKLTGKLIYEFDGITVHQHPDGYLISNGTDLAFQKEMPCLSAEPLRIILSENSLGSYDRFQLEKFGNILTPGPGMDKRSRQEEFDRWFSQQEMAMEFDMMGY